MLASTVSLAVSTVLQAVDGVALKAMVDTWATASDANATSVFYAALAVRQVEIGLASMDALIFGLSACLVGAALLIDRRAPRPFGVLAIGGGLTMLTSGVVIGASGFSELAMTLNLLASSLLLAWLVAFAVWSWVAEIRPAHHRSLRETRPLSAGIDASRQRRHALLRRPGRR